LETYDKYLFFIFYISESQDGSTYLLEESMYSIIE